MKLVKIISKLKNTVLWRVILAKLIYPSYKFLWLNLINYEGKRLFTKFKKGNEENNIIHIDEDKPYAIIRNDKTFLILLTKFLNKLITI